jgi:hypothetical protein
MWRNCCVAKHHAKSFGEVDSSLGLGVGGNSTSKNWMLREKKIRRFNSAISVVLMTPGEVFRVFLNHYSISHRNTIKQSDFLRFMTNRIHMPPFLEGWTLGTLKAPGIWAP